MSTSTSKFRELVVLLLRVDGLPAVRKPDPQRRASEAVVLDSERGDIQGLTGWTINARHEVTRDLAGGLDDARRDADADGNPKFACIWPRHGRPGTDAYVVMSLATFGAVLRTELGVD